MKSFNKKILLSVFSLSIFLMSNAHAIQSNGAFHQSGAAQSLLGGKGDTEEKTVCLWGSKVYSIGGIHKELEKVVHHFYGPDTYVYSSHQCTKTGWKKIS